MDLDYYAKRKGEERELEIGWKENRILQHLDDDSALLDVGCAGGSTNKLAEKAGADYYGIDYNDNFIELCKERGLNVKQCDIATESIPYDEDSFDVVLCSHVLEHVNTRSQIKFFKDLSRVCKKGGYIFFFAPTPYHWYFWDEETHVRPCTHGQLAKLAKNFDFAVVEAKYSLLRWLPTSWQRYLRLPPIRFFLWETFLVAKKN